MSARNTWALNSNRKLYLPYINNNNKKITKQNKTKKQYGGEILHKPDRRTCSLLTLDDRVWQPAQPANAGTPRLGGGEQGI